MLENIFKYCQKSGAVYLLNVSKKWAARVIKTDAKLLFSQTNPSKLISESFVLKCRWFKY